ncbi:hypothetical protein ACHAXN_009234 [Cyclotella atomus]
MASDNKNPPPPLPHPSPRGGSTRYYYQPQHPYGGQPPYYGGDRYSSHYESSPRHGGYRADPYYRGPPPSHPLDAHGPPRESREVPSYHHHHHQQHYLQPRGGLAPSKSGAFVRYQPQNHRYVPREEERDAPPAAAAGAGGGMELREDPDQDVKLVGISNSERGKSAKDEPVETKEKEQASNEEGPVKMDHCPDQDEEGDKPQAKAPEQNGPKLPQEESKIVNTEQQQQPLLEPLSTKRPRSEPNVDDNTPKAGVYRHNPSSFFPMTNSHPRLPPPKRSRPNEEFYPNRHHPYDHNKPPHDNKPHPQSTHRPLRPLPTHRRSFSLESECRNDKHVKSHRDEEYRFRPASYSPSTHSLVSRSFDFYNNEEDRSLTSLDMKGSMSWEVPALSAIMSFGQLNNDSLKSPGDSLRDDKRDSSLRHDEGRDSRDDSRREDNGPHMPPIPTHGNAVDRMNLDKSFLAPRPNIPNRDDSNRCEPREYYHRSLPAQQGYYTRSPRTNSRYGPPDNNDRYYEMMDGRQYYRKEVRRYDPNPPPMEMMMDRRDPYESQRGRSYRRYEERHHGRSPPPPPSREYTYNDTPGGLSSRSFDSRSLGEMDEPVNSLLYRPSFSWERGLDQVAAVPPVDNHYDPHPPNNSILIQLADQQRIMKALALRNEIRTIGNPHSSIGLILLLAMPNDRHCLSETLCIIRNNVEVFTATAADISAPAPGRKRPVQVGQVGLRCVYCRMCTNDRVKRAMCFPSSTKRIYRALIDMKLDHFPSCPYIPQGLKARLEELSANSSRSTGMTVQYFVKSAKELGMVDMEEGMFIDLRRVGKEEQAPFFQQPLLPPVEHSQSRIVHHHPHSAAGVAEKSPAGNKAQFKPPKPTQMETDPNIKRYHGKVLLSFSDDSSFLSPLRCFLRRNVCAFTATSNDIAVRTPTTFSVRVGQVGVGCVHCLSVPPKQRSNRAVCFPFTLARIYQSVADIQRFHLGECKMMPPDVRAEFLQLQSESAKGSRGLATRTYWIDSARKLGLADGPCGMYFSRDPTLPPSLENDESLDLLAQVATNANTNFKPLVTPEDKPTIADFLYVVMEQLQPCLFTDADRNKRRSKNLGSVGVECKHCAGKIDARKFFWSSVSAAESNFVSVHSHMMDCKYIPDDFKQELAKMKSLRREQTSRLKTGSQKAFFTRVWNRLHSKPDDEKPEEKPKAKKRASSKPDVAQVPSNVPEMPSALPPSKSLDDAPFDSMVLPSGGSNDELRALLESKSTLSSMPSIELDPTKPEEMEAPNEEGKPDSDSKMDGSGDSAIAIKSSMSSVAHEMSAVSVRSKEAEQDAKSVGV